MTTNPCPICGSAEAPKFSTESSWCRDCSKREIAEQTLRRWEVQHRQVVEYEPHDG